MYVYMHPHDTFSTIQSHSRVCLFEGWLGHEWVSISHGLHHWEVVNIHFEEHWSHQGVLGNHIVLVSQSAALAVFV